MRADERKGSASRSHLTPTGSRETHKLQNKLICDNKLDNADVLTKVAAVTCACGERPNISELKY